MIEKMSMADFYEKFQQEPLSIIDIRELDEFVRGHVPGSIFLPLSSITEDYVRLSKNDTHYIICRAAHRSETASQFLASLGFQVVDVQGGISVWPGEKMLGE